MAEDLELQSVYDLIANRVPEYTKEYESLYVENELQDDLERTLSHTDGKLPKFTKVILKGLKTKGFNGKEGLLQEFNNKTGRYSIELEDKNIKKVKREKFELKKENQTICVNPYPEEKKKFFLKKRSEWTKICKPLNELDEDDKKHIIARRAYMKTRSEIDTSELDKQREDETEEGYKRRMQKKYEFLLTQGYKLRNLVGKGKFDLDFINYTKNGDESYPNMQACVHEGTEVVPSCRYDGELPNEAGADAMAMDDDDTRGTESAIDNIFAFRYYFERLTFEGEIFEGLENLFPPGEFDDENEKTGLDDDRREKVYTELEDKKTKRTLAEQLLQGAESLLKTQQAKYELEQKMNPDANTNAMLVQNSQAEIEGLENDIDILDAEIEVLEEELRGISTIRSKKGRTRDVEQKQQIQGSDDFLRYFFVISKIAGVDIAKPLTTSSEQKYAEYVKGVHEYLIKSRSAPQSPVDFLKRFERRDKRLKKILPEWIFSDVHKYFLNMYEFKEFSSLIQYYIDAILRHLDIIPLEWQQTREPDTIPRDPAIEAPQKMSLEGPKSASIYNFIGAGGDDLFAAFLELKNEQTAQEEKTDGPLRFLKDRVKGPNYTTIAVFLAKILKDNIKFFDVLTNFFETETKSTVLFRTQSIQIGVKADKLFKQGRLKPELKKMYDRLKKGDKDFFKGMRMMIKAELNLTKEQVEDYDLSHSFFAGLRHYEKLQDEMEAFKMFENSNDTYVKRAEVMKLAEPDSGGFLQFLDTKYTESDIKIDNDDKISSAEYYGDRKSMEAVSSEQIRKDVEKKFKEDVFTDADRDEIIRVIKRTTQILEDEKEEEVLKVEQEELQEGLPGRDSMFLDAIETYTEQLGLEGVEIKEDEDSFSVFALTAPEKRMALQNKTQIDSSDDEDENQMMIQNKIPDSVSAIAQINRYFSDTKNNQNFYHLLESMSERLKTDILNDTRYCGIELEEDIEAVVGMLAEREEPTFFEFVCEKEHIQALDGTKRDAEPLFFMFQRAFLILMEDDDVIKNLDEKEYKYAPLDFSRRYFTFLAQDKPRARIGECEYEKGSPFPPSALLRFKDSWKFPCPDTPMVLGAKAEKRKRAVESDDEEEAQEEDDSSMVEDTEKDEEEDTADCYPEKNDFRKVTYKQNKNIRNTISDDDFVKIAFENTETEVSDTGEILFEKPTIHSLWAAILNRHYESLKQNKLIRLFLKKMDFVNDPKDDDDVVKNSKILFKLLTEIFKHTVYFLDSLYALAKMYYDTGEYMPNNDKDAELFYKLETYAKSLEVQPPRVRLLKNTENLQAFEDFFANARNTLNAGEFPNKTKMGELKNYIQSALNGGKDNNKPDFIRRLKFDEQKQYKRFLPVFSQRESTFACRGGKGLAVEGELLKSLNERFISDQEKLYANEDTRETTTSLGKIISKNKYTYELDGKYGHRVIFKQGNTNPMKDDEPEKKKRRTRNFPRKEGATKRKRPDIKSDQETQNKLRALFDKSPAAKRKKQALIAAVAAGMRRTNALSLRDKVRDSMAREKSRRELGTSLVSDVDVTEASFDAMARLDSGVRYTFPDIGSRVYVLERPVPGEEVYTLRAEDNEGVFVAGARGRTTAVAVVDEDMRAASESSDLGLAGVIGAAVAIGHCSEKGCDDACCEEMEMGIGCSCGEEVSDEAAGVIGDAYAANKDDATIADMIDLDAGEEAEGAAAIVGNIVSIHDLVYV